MMSDNDIRKGFQSKLSGFEAPVLPDGWESVERSLKAVAAARTVFRRRWYAGSVVAGLVLLIGSILFIRNPMEQTETMVSESTTTTPFTGSIPDPGTEPETASESVPDPVVRPAGSGRLLGARTSLKARTGKEPVVRPSTPEEMMAAWMEREELEAKSVEKDAEQNGKDLLMEEMIIVAGGDHSSLFAGAGAAGRGKGTLLLAVNGRGGLTGYQQTVNTPMTLRSANALPSEDKYLSEANQLRPQVNMADNISEMEHDQPVSFGITVSKYLLDDLSVETGLVYSYLHSKTRNANNYSQIDEVQKLHYLGIPLNVNYNLFSLRRLNVYASVGGMVEKDVHGEYQRVKEEQAGQAVNFKNASGESVAMEVDKISFRNPQFSVNAGIGLSYPLYDRLRLYGKVGGAYYFDAKNQDRKTNRVHKTIYSDRKIVMDLNVGLRYEF